MLMTGSEENSNFFWERAIFRHLFECIVKEGGKFYPDSCDVVERVEKVNDERRCRFLALYLFLPEVKSSCTAELM
jgi:hypothetical protein